MGHHYGGLTLQGIVVAPVEAFTAVLLQVNVRYKTRAAIRLTGLDI